MHVSLVFFLHVCSKILLINVVHIFHDPSTIMGWDSHFQQFHREVQQKQRGTWQIKSWNKLWHYNSLHNCWFCSLRAQNKERQSRGESWMLSGQMSGEAAKRHMKCMRMSSKKKTTFLSHSPEGLAIGTSQTH